VVIENEKYRMKYLKKSILILLTVSVLFACDKEEYTSTISSEKTVLVYMIADNSLNSYVKVNVDSMCSGMKSAAVGDNLLIYENGSDEVPKLLKISKQSDGTVKQSVLKTYAEQNSVSPTVMESILSDMCSYCPLVHYSLVLWSHGYGWFPGNSTKTLTRWFGYDTKYNSEMSISDLVTALSNAPHFDTILFDACFMGGVETDYALRKNADYIIASPSEVMGAGFPYQNVMPHLFGETESDNVAAATAYYTYYKNIPVTSGISYPSASVGCVKCSEMDSLALLTSALIKAHASDLDSFNASSVQYMEGNSPHLFYDFGDWVKAFTIESERASFETELNKAVVYKASTPIIYSAVNGSQYIKMNSFCGLNCYIPQSTTAEYNTAYHLCDWYAAAGWNSTCW
jgi:hypothetical protein